MTIMRKYLEAQLGDLESPIYETLLDTGNGVDPAFYSPLKRIFLTLDEYLGDALLPIRGSSYANGDYISAVMCLESGELLEAVVIFDQLIDFLRKPSKETRKLEFPSAPEIIERLEDLLEQLGRILKRAASSEVTLLLEEYFDELYSHRLSMEQESYVKLRELRAISSAVWHIGPTSELVGNFLNAAEPIDYFSREQELIRDWRKTLSGAVEDLAVEELWREQTDKSSHANISR